MKIAMQLVVFAMIIMLAQGQGWSDYGEVAMGRSFVIQTGSK